MDSFTIDNFIQVEILIEGQKYPEHISGADGVSSLFERELYSTRNDRHALSEYGVHIHQIKVGDEIKLGPRGIRYAISNIIIEYFSTNPISDLKTPFISVQLFVQAL